MRSTVTIFGAVGVLLVIAVRLAATPLSTGFTYQGKLSDGGLGANGSYDLTFSIYDAVTNGAQVGATITNSAVSVTNGLFTVSLDFGASSFNGEARWLEISVRADSNSTYTVLSPRQAISATPYSFAAATLISPLSPGLLPANIPRLDTNQLFIGSNIFSGPAILTNAANLFAGAFSGDGGGLTNLSSTAIRRVLTAPVPSSDTNYIVDFLTDVVQITASTNVNFLQSTNRPAVSCYTECVWYIQGGTTNRLLTLNPNWTPMGTLATNNPFLLVSNKLSILAFSARGPAETNVVYAIARQE